MAKAGLARTAGEGPVLVSDPRVSRSQLLRLGLVLTLVVLVLASLRFARYDWTGSSMTLLPDSLEEEISSDCTELIGSYTTDSGRVIQPVAVDQEQYMSMVAMYRGTPVDDLQSECLYVPFVGRFAIPFVAAQLPFGEAVSLALVNLTMMMVALWAMLAALRSQGATPRVFVVVGFLFAVGWNTLMVSAEILTDPGVLAVVSVGWWLVVRRRLWWALALLAISIPVRETVLILAPVVLAAAWLQSRDGPDESERPSGLWFASLAAACVVVPVLAVSAWSQVAPEADASWDSAPSVTAFLFNLGTLSFLTVVVAGAPLFVPALLQLRNEIRRAGWFETVTRPASVGLLGVCALCLWVFVAADLSPRFLWVGFPFAASMTADWLGEGHLGALLDRVRPERLVGA
jgi:hypothetical protein